MAEPSHDAVTQYSFVLTDVIIPDGHDDEGIQYISFPAMLYH